jgi:hypothetical protein
MMMIEIKMMEVRVQPKGMPDALAEAVAYNMSIMDDDGDRCKTVG